MSERLNDIELSTNLSPEEELLQNLRLLPEMTAELAKDVQADIIEAVDIYLGHDTTTDLTTNHAATWITHSVIAERPFLTQEAVVALKNMIHHYLVRQAESSI